MACSASTRMGSGANAITRQQKSFSTLSAVQPRDPIVVRHRCCRHAGVCGETDMTDDSLKEFRIRVAHRQQQKLRASALTQDVNEYSENPYYGQPYANGAPPPYGQVVGAPMYQVFCLSPCVWIVVSQESPNLSFRCLMLTGKIVQNSGMSAGTAGMLGVGAGMLGGMMIGNAMASHEAHYGKPLVVSLNPRRATVIRCSQGTIMTACTPT
eukprot:763994-Hanusia_phi.AAC.3